MKRLRVALEWWVFVPLLPVLGMLWADYWAASFSMLGLGRLAWAAKAVSLLCVIVMLPDMLCAFVMFHSERSSYPPMSQANHLTRRCCFDRLKA